MSSRKKVVKALCAVEIFLAAVAALLPLTVFPFCDTHGHCQDSSMVEIALAVIIIVSAVAAILSTGVEAPRMLSAVTAVSGVFMIIFPTWLIGVCASTEMPCHYGLLPSWNLMGGVIVIISAIIFFTAREAA